MRIGIDWIEFPGLRGARDAYLHIKATHYVAPGLKRSMTLAGRSGRLP
jgi:hypothetical protein